ncbi:phosphoserine phosphatase SerB [Sphingoaurantiacus capsulatus]|uniref:Phosphoserine phosphatase n=1 Tax=Sphingoaurantiacus capsulatus TaxID=1771310 RepID=A0ABV7XAF9_9SPHN
MNILTLVAPERLSPGDVSAASDALRGIDAQLGMTGWIDRDKACDVQFRGAEVAAARAAVDALGLPIDIFVQPRATREKQMIIADMDSTMITVECIDELADYAGIKPQIAAVTEAAMRGELDFAEALDARVALLKGLAATAIDRCHEERVRLMPGARTLVQTMRARGSHSVLVSGGFTAFADRVGAAIGFAKVIANELLIDGEALAGTVAKPIVDSDTKLKTLRAEASVHGIPIDATLAVGDGANDIPMIEAAGLGVAYHAKPKTEAAAAAAVRQGDLTALLYAQGIPRREWVAD